jgi:hypothetical protein
MHVLVGLNRGGVIAVLPERSLWGWHTKNP